MYLDLEYCKFIIKNLRCVPSSLLLLSPSPLKHKAVFQAKLPLARQLQMPPKISPSRPSPAKVRSPSSPSRSLLRRRRRNRKLKLMQRSKSQRQNLSSGMESPMPLLLCLLKPLAGSIYSWDSPLVSTTPSRSDGETRTADLASSTPLSTLLATLDTSIRHSAQLLAASLETQCNSHSLI